MVSSWTSARLQRLFHRYNRKFWGGALPDLTVRDCRFDDGSLGQCDRERKRIDIDVARHSTDAEVRSTLLHEMAHAADSNRGRAHGYGFWTQVESLLQQGAPLLLGSGELPGHLTSGGARPARFPGARSAVAVVERRREAQLLRDIPKDVAVHEITDDDVLLQFSEAGRETTWAIARETIGYRNALLDVEGRPRSASCARMIERGRRAHQRSRREFLKEERWRHRIEQASASRGELQPSRDSQPPLG